MKKRKIFVYSVLAILLLILACIVYVSLRPAEKVIDKWTGPGQADGVIVPIEPSENAFHCIGKKDYLEEHWYFDARLDSGYVVVGFLQAIEMLSKKPGVELHIYKPSGEKLSVVKSYSDEDLRASEQKCDIRVGKNHAYGIYPEDGGYPEYHLFISEGDMEADLTFYSELSGWKPGEGKTYYGDKGYFAWVVAVPRARVEGTIKIGNETISAKGIGYHDHNWATADLRKILSYWYWGRLYAKDFTLLYAYVKTNKRFGNVASKPLMLAYKDKILYSTGEMTLSEGNPIFSDKANRAYPSSLKIDVPGKISLNLNVNKVIDAVDLLKDANPILKWGVHTFVGRPGWFRFNSEYTLHVDYEGKSYDVKGETLHEMVAVGG